MHCPRCGQQQVSEDTRFCSRCGFPLAGVTQLIANGGALPEISSPPSGGAKKDSPRKRGLKQGLFIFLLTFLVVPLVAILSIAVEVREPFAVAICAVLLSVGGLLRMIYALLFESGEPYDSGGAGGGKTLEQNVMNAAQNILGKNPAAGALPPQQSIPTSTYVPPAGGSAGSWRDTKDLTAQPPDSVTEKTTRFLDRE